MSLDILTALLSQKYFTQLAAYATKNGCCCGG